MDKSLSLGSSTARHRHLQSCSYHSTCLQKAASQLKVGVQGPCSPSPLCRSLPHCSRDRAGVVCRAESGGSFNPFKDPKKEDAARRALEDMFKGQQDTLAAFDSKGGGSGGQGGSGGRGGSSGGGQGWSLPDWRGWLSSFVGRFGELGKAIQAILAFAAVMLAFCYLGTAISFVTGIGTLVIRWVLRLDARRSPVAKPIPVDAPAAEAHGLGQALGAYERSVMLKYGPPPAHEQGAAL